MSHLYLCFCKLSSCREYTKYTQLLRISLVKGLSCPWTDSGIFYLLHATETIFQIKSVGCYAKNILIEDIKFIWLYRIAFIHDVGMPVC